MGIVKIAYRSIGERSPTGSMGTLPYIIGYTTNSNLGPGRVQILKTSLGNTLVCGVPVSRPEGDSIGQVSVLMYPFPISW